jgi:hypothetical protein
MVLLYEKVSNAWRFPNTPNTPGTHFSCKRDWYSNLTELKHILRTKLCKATLGWNLAVLWLQEDYCWWCLYCCVCRIENSPCALNSNHRTGLPLLPLPDQRCADCEKLRRCKKGIRAQHGLVNGSFFLGVNRQDWICKKKKKKKKSITFRILHTK